MYCKKYWTSVNYNCDKQLCVYHKDGSCTVYEYKSPETAWDELMLIAQGDPYRVSKQKLIEWADKHEEGIKALPAYYHSIDHPDYDTFAKKEEAKIRKKGIFWPGGSNE